MWLDLANSHSTKIDGRGKVIVCQFTHKDKKTQIRKMWI